jgi:hypothetical protein
MRKLVLILPLLFLVSCSEPNYNTRELPTKYPETPTSGSAYDATEALYGVKK